MGQKLDKICDVLEWSMTWLFNKTDPLHSCDECGLIETRSKGFVCTSSIYHFGCPHTERFREEQKEWLQTKRDGFNERRLREIVREEIQRIGGSDNG